MSQKKPRERNPVGDPTREAIASLQGYVYQIYQSTLAWVELEDDEILYLEVAEDFAKVARGKFEAVQVKKTTKSVTINSKEIITTINSFVELQNKNPNLKVTLRHLTTSKIGKEQKTEHRIGDIPTLEAWRKLAKFGELSKLRCILEQSKISKKAKEFVNNIDDQNLRERFLKRIHFDCEAPNSQILEQQLKSKISKLLIDRGGVYSQTENCVAALMQTILKLSAKSQINERYVDRTSLEIHLEKITQVTINRNILETQNRLINKILTVNLPSETSLSKAQIFRPIPIADTPLPNSLASRQSEIRQLQQILESVGICWITGSAGMGKTIASRILAYNITGDWASINLRGKSIEQVVGELVQAADSMKGFGLSGLIVDDLCQVMEPSVLDSLHYLVHSANRSDVLLVLNSSESPTSDFRFLCDLQAEFTRTLSGFCEEDIQEILAKYGVDNIKIWAKYIYHVSGGGHPQLTMAFIQSMVASGWNPNELQTLNGLLRESSAISQVRQRTRKRLLANMANENRRLIERLSLKVGGFNRELAIDLGKIEPLISDAGIILDSLIGSWVDQLEGDRFDLSPLLTGFAEQTLNTNEKTEIHHKIADSLLKKQKFHIQDMDSALLSAFCGKNEAAIVKLCISILGSDSSDLKRIAPYLTTFKMLRTDTYIYPTNPTVSLMVRGTQVLLMNLESNSQVKIQDILNCFYEEAQNVSNNILAAAISLIVYYQLLFQTSKAGLGTSFISIIQKLNQLLENENCTLPPEDLDIFKKGYKDNIPVIGILFINQARQLSKIEELTMVFEFLENSSSELRTKLLSPLGKEDFEVDTLVSGAWLNEHTEDSIDPEAHSEVFENLEKLARGWNYSDLAVSCRKFRVIIIDEYGNDKNRALEILEEGLSIYGQTNSELVRAKAKILHRSDDHENSLSLSKILIESDASLSEVEKTFLGREAAISAEMLGDFETARRYYLFGSTAASKTNLDSMKAIHIGLRADAALASWHNGDRQTCLQDFVTVLEDLNKIKPDQTLRNVHCHTLVRHVLLWLGNDVSGGKYLLKDQEEILILPGCISNPEPHPEIKERPLLPIEMSWYMLASVENYTLLNAGITEKLKQHLPCGPVIEGQILLSQPKMYKALSQLDTKLFMEALGAIISVYAIAIEKRKSSTGIDFKKVTYGTLPIATKEQQEKLQSTADQFILLFCTICIFKDRIKTIPLLLTGLSDVKGVTVTPILIDRLQRNGPVKDKNIGFACLIQKYTKGTTVSLPREIFELAFLAIQLAHNNGFYKLVTEILLQWLIVKCTYILEHQRFILKQLPLHEADIRASLEQNDLSVESRVVKILTTILPTLGISNQSELTQILSDLPK